MFCLVGCSWCSSLLYFHHYGRRCLKLWIRYGCKISSIILFEFSFRWSRREQSRRFHLNMALQGGSMIKQCELLFFSSCFLKSDIFLQLVDDCITFWNDFFVVSTNWNQKCCTVLWVENEEVSMIPFLYGSAMHMAEGFYSSKNLHSN